MNEHTFQYFLALLITCALGLGLGVIAFAFAPQLIAGFMAIGKGLMVVGIATTIGWVTLR